MASKKISINQYGNFVITRGEIIKEFGCDRCAQAKRSKVFVNWTDLKGVEKVICNGCYGRMVSGITL